MKVLTADETGLIKTVSVEEAKVVAKAGFQNRDQAVQCLSWASGAGPSGDHVAWATKCGQLKCAELPLHSGATNKEQQKPAYSEAELITEDLYEKLSGLDLVYDSTEALFPSRVITCDESGGVRVTEFPAEPSDAEDEPTVIEGDNAIVKTFDVGDRVGRMRFRNGFVAVGGKEHDLQVWDVETQKEVFRARNVAHDWLDMRVPVWITDLQFLGQNPDKNGKMNHTIVTGTAHKQVRMYDTRAKRKPVRDINLEKFVGHINTIAAVGEDQAVVADAQGKVLRVDLTSGKTMGSYRGAVGSVRALSVHPTLPVIATGGLDRFVRVYDIESKELLSQTYVKQRLTDVLFGDEENVEPEEDETKKRSNDSEGEGDDDVWDELEERSRDRKKSRRNE